jgi:hypothetical protein
MVGPATMITEVQTQMVGIEKITCSFQGKGRNGCNNIATTTERRIRTVNPPGRVLARLPLGRRSDFAGGYVGVLQCWQPLQSNTFLQNIAEGELQEWP